LPRLIKRLHRTRGLPPGALVHIGEKKTEKVRISVLDYDTSILRKKKLKKLRIAFLLKINLLSLGLI